MLLLIIGLVCFLVGSWLLFDELYWRWRAERVTGIRIGVLPSISSRNLRGGGGVAIYNSVYRYTAASGAPIDACSNIGGSNLDVLPTGASVTLMVFPREPHAVRETRGYSIESIGAVFFIGGLFVIHLSEPGWSVMQIVGIGAAIVVLVFFLKKLLRINGSSGAPPNSPRPNPVRAEDIRTLGPVPATAARRGALVPFVASLLMLTVAVFIARSTASLQFSGLRANGTVTALRSRSSRHSNTYHPRVRFTTANGDIVDFENAEGSNPPENQVGDVVEVMYAADKPTHAMVDRGVWNWFFPAMLGLFGLPIALLSARALVQGRKLKVKP